MARGIRLYSSGVLVAPEVIYSGVLDVAEFERLQIVVTYGGEEAVTESGLYILVPERGSESTFIATIGLGDISPGGIYSGHVGPGAVSGDFFLDIPLPDRLAVSMTATEQGEMTIEVWGQA